MATPLRTKPDRQTPNSGLEVRSFQFTARREGEGDDGKLKLSGHAAVFNRETVLVPKNAWYEGSPEIRELIEPGAFSKTLKEKDVRALWNHDSNYPIGRSGNGTLNLWEDERGLANEIFPPDTALIRDMVIAPIERGDVDQMSFQFRIVRDKVERSSGTVLVSLLEVELIEVSPCTIPAYTQTDITLSARSRSRIEELRHELAPHDDALHLGVELAVRRHRLVVA